MELPDEQAGFRPGKGTRDMLVILQILIENVCRLSKGKLYLLFIDYTKAFDTVSDPLLFSFHHVGGTTFGGTDSGAVSAALTAVRW